MFGMTSEEFWEDDPQLYWSYRISFMKKMEMEQLQQVEQIKYSSWLNGNLNCTATSVSLSNAFSKGKKTEFPAYDKVFKKVEKQEPKKTEKEVNNYVAKVNNFWARF